MIDGYLALIDRFLGSDISAADFAAAYLDRFKRETGSLSEPSYHAVDELFGDADSFEPDDALRAELNARRPGFYLDAGGLRERAGRVAERLRALQ